MLTQESLWLISVSYQQILTFYLTLYISSFFKFILETILFFAGYYLAMHNVVKDETKYIGIDANLSLITAFEV